MRCFFLVALALAGCATDSGIVPNGQGGYLIAKQQATGFPGLGNLKPEILKEANALCANRSKALHVTNVIESQPPYILGNYPRVEVQFTCE